MCPAKPARNSIVHILAALCLGASITAAYGAEDSSDQRALTILGAASLTEVLSEVAEAFTQTTATPVRLSFTASSTAARQIESGAPADIFASAHPRWVRYLIDRDLVSADEVVAPIGNRLVFVAVEDRLQTSASVADTIVHTLGEGGWLAMGDPDHVPAGMYGRDALESLGLWSAVQRRLVRAENVRSTLALVTRREAAGGIVYDTDIPNTGVPGLVAVSLGVPEERVRYRFALVRGGNAMAGRQFLGFLSSAAAGDVFRRRGFQLLP